MKKHMFALILSAMAAAPFVAHAEGAFVGASAGRVEQKLTVEGSSIRENSVGYKLYGGYSFTKNLSVEAGFADLQKAEVSNLGYGVSSKPQSVFATAAYSFSVNDDLSLFGKLGVAYNHVKVGAFTPKDSASASDNQVTPVFGVGAEVTFTKQISLVTEYENFGKVAKDGGDHVKADLLSIGIRYRF